MANVHILILISWVWASCAHHGAVHTKPLPAEKEETAPFRLADKKFEAILKPSKNRKELSLRYKKKHYDHWLKYFSGKNKKRFLRQLKNGDKYRNIIQAVFQKHGLPEDLFYVGLIESGFYTHARSHASAVGPWQFIRGTGRRYKLRVDRNVDERRSIYKSTEAAAQYFKDLYNIFGSWELALCAYNAGEYRIINAIRKGNTRDYKELVKKKLIPRETIFYIPKVAVARYLDKRWKRVVDERASDLYNNVDFLKIASTINISRIAKNVGIRWETLKRLNPDLNSYWIRVRRRTFDLYIPKGKKQVAINYLKSSGYAVNKYLAKKQSGRKYGKRRLSRVGKGRGYYRVRRGDSLTSIAKKFGTTVGSIKKKNGLRSGKILVGQRLNIFHGRTKKRIKNYYRVRRGDNLVGIAKKFGTTVSGIKKKNGLRSGKILAGQKLRVPASRKNKYYVVKRGDNLTRIARRFGVSIARILRINRLKNEIIYPRQKIIIPST